MLLATRAFLERAKAPLFLEVVWSVFFSLCSLEKTGAALSKSTAPRNDTRRFRRMAGMRSLLVFSSKLSNSASDLLPPVRRNRARQVHGEHLVVIAAAQDLEHDGLSRLELGNDATVVAD